MRRRFIHFISCVVVLSIVLTSTAGAVDPDLVGRWRFDDGSGTTVEDISGNGNPGTLTG